MKGQSNILHSAVPANNPNTCQWRHCSLLISCAMICSFEEVCRTIEDVMADDSRHFTDIKDIRPGIKNLHCLFIVLEVGKLPLSSRSLPVWSDSKSTLKFTAISCRESHQNERCPCRSGMSCRRQNRLNNGVRLGRSRRNSSTRRYH